MGLPEGFDRVCVRLTLQPHFVPAELHSSFAIIFLMNHCGFTLLLYHESLRDHAKLQLQTVADWCADQMKKRYKGHFIAQPVP